MGEIKFSIIIPTNNRYDLLNNSLISIQKLLDLNENEIIIVDNSNLPNYKPIIYHHNVIYIHNNLKSNANFARQIGINKSRGKFLVFLDDDDEWLDGRVKELYKAHFINNSDIYFANFQISGSIKSKLINNFKNFLFVSNNIIRENYLGGFSVLSIRKSILIKYSLTLDVDLASCQDWSFYIDLYKYFPNHLIKSYNKPTIKYNIHTNGNISSNISFKILGRLYILKKLNLKSNKRIRVKHILALKLLRIKRDNIITFKSFLFFLKHFDIFLFTQFIKCALF